MKSLFRVTWIHTYTLEMRALEPRVLYLTVRYQEKHGVLAGPSKQADDTS